MKIQLKHSLLLLDHKHFILVKMDTIFWEMAASETVSVIERLVPVLGSGIDPDPTCEGINKVQINRI